jgi:NAD(P)-dependent dehydrogenase (short-subunit alcohol dehydrogenase family)
MKSVVITGSSRGLGLALAKRFRKAGFNVVINGLNADRLETAKQALEPCLATEGLLLFPAAYLILQS